MNTNHQTLPSNPEPRTPAQIVAAALECSLDLFKVWGSARLALTLTNAFYQGKPLTTDEIAEICSQSPETVRRQLKALINISRVRVIKEGRNVRYKATTEWATWTYEHVAGVVGLPKLNSG